MTSDQVFNSRIVCKLAKVTQRQLNHWVKAGVISPSSIGKGRGKKLLFNFTDLVQLKTASGLRGQGISLQNIRNSLEYIRAQFPHVAKPLAELKFLTDGKDVFILTTDVNELAQIINASKSGQVVWIFKLGEAIKELEEDVQMFILGEKEVIRVGHRECLVRIVPDPVDGGYVAECTELPGCFSQGETKGEVRTNIKKAILDWLGEEESQRIRA